MSGKTKISIITTSYNSEQTIRKTIESVIAQDYDNVEYIIVDGGSTDNTISIVKEFGAKISTIISEPDRGVYDAINKGIRAATGDVVGLLHSDDFYADSAVLSNVVEEMEVSGAATLYADLQYVDRDNPSVVKRNWDSGDYSRDMFLKGWMPPHPTFFVRRGIYLKYGLYRLELEQSADYELMLRYLYKFNLSTTYLERVITKMRVGGKSNVSLRNRIKANLEDRKAWKVNSLDPHFATLYRKPLSKIGQFVPQANVKTSSMVAYPFLLLANRLFTYLS